MLAILLGIATVMWLTLFWDSFAVESYLYLLGFIKLPLVVLLYLCIASNFVEPIIMIVSKTRRYHDLLHLPMMVWYGWSVLYTYAIGNLKGLLNIPQTWFRTPKFLRADVGVVPKTPLPVRLFNAGACILLMGLYLTEGWAFGWFDEFALLLLPAFLLGSIK